MDIEAPFIILFALVAAAALLYVWYLACREFAFIASEKGWSERRYFHFCFWLGLVGLLMVIALPDRGNDDDSASQPTPASRPAQAATVNPPAQKASDRPTADLHRPEASPEASAVKPTKAAGAPTPDPQPTWSCHCGTQNSASTFLCSGCRALWHCTCGKLNDRQAHKCTACGAWHCTCGKLNPAARGTCDSCGEAKPR